MELHPHEPPRLELARLPTPVIALHNLAQQFGMEQLLLKRDDLTGFETSGNKIRKLEYVLAHAREQGADTLVTHGGVQSNHCRATAAIGARLGLRVRLILRSPHADPTKDGNLFLDHLFNAQISYHSPDEYTRQLPQVVAAALAEERGKGYSPYFFPVGASTPLGCWGYVRCLGELADQLDRQNPVDIFCATSSGGTQVGLMLGKALHKLEHWKVIGIPVSDSLAYFQRELRKLERDVVRAYGLELTEQASPIHLVDGFIGEGYAIPYPDAVETIRSMARLEGILLDPSYTAKALTGMLSLIRNGGLREGATPVFIHSGGGFGLFARRDLFD